MKTIRSVFQSIFKDQKATQLFVSAAVLCVVNFILSWSGLIPLLVFLSAISLSTFILQNVEARKTVQNALTSVLGVRLNEAIEPTDDYSKVDIELDEAIESFFRTIIKNFIASWYCNLSRDETFIWNLKQEIAEAVRDLTRRVRNVDHAKLLSNKLLPAIYSHLDILSRINHAENASQAFIDNENPVHPATYSRNSEIEYLRQLSQQLLSFLVSRKNFESKVIIDLLKEVLTSAVFLPLMDIISDPATINYLVILATNPKVQQFEKSKGKKVVLLENFTKQFELRLDDENIENDLSGNFLKDQEKLYSFMQHLKSKSSSDIELLKFYLDVEHLNEQLENSNVITNPNKLSELQQKSEKLLIFYQDFLHREESSEKKSNDLVEAHNNARTTLEMKWKNDFYKSAEYFQLIYGDKESSSVDNSTKASEFPAFHQKFSSKLKNAITIRTGTVEGIEATEIPIWDALDHPLGQSSYYNSVAVKLRKERGQDLDNFMQSFFHSIEQEADVGEDVASTQTRDENRKRRLPNLLGNVELYKNLFNISGQSKVCQNSLESHVKTTVDSVIYFLESILNVHKIFLRIASGILKLLPDADNLICSLLRNFLNKIINQAILATLIHELQEKIFSSQPTVPPSREELTKRRELAVVRIENVHKNLVRILGHLQNPVLNKNLMYCLLDLIAVELFPLSRA